MASRRSSLLLPWLATALLLGCGDRELGSSPPGANDGGGDASLPAPAAPMAPAFGAELPQVRGGALFVNPEVFPTAPLHIRVTGSARIVSATIDDRVVEATDDDGDGDWVAFLPVASLSDGTHGLSVRAEAKAPQGRGPEAVDFRVELVVSREGTALTEWVSVGPAATPRLHRRGGELWLTWTDHTGERPRAWLRRIDGGGRFVGDVVSLLPDDAGATRAHVAVGGDALGVLDQVPAMPFTNHFRVVGFDGSPRSPVFDLDRGGLTGHLGADVVFDGSGYVLAWKAGDDQTRVRVLWARVDAETFAMTGPVEVWGPAASNTEGGFDLSARVAVAAVPGASVVTVTRTYTPQSLGERTNKCEVAVVRPDGAIASSGFCDGGEGFTFHHQSRVFARDDGFVLLWSQDALGANSNPPAAFLGVTGTLDGIAPATRHRGTTLLTAPRYRSDPLYLPHPARHAVLVWEDSRSLESATVEKPGRVELWAATVGPDLTVTNARAVPHALLYSSLSDARGAVVGTNVPLVWVDDRLSGGDGLMRRPQILFDTLWY